MWSIESIVIMAKHPFPVHKYVYQSANCDVVWKWIIFRMMDRECVFCAHHLSTFAEALGVLRPKIFVFPFIQNRFLSSSSRLTAARFTQWKRTWMCAVHNGEFCLLNFVWRHHLHVPMYAQPITLLWKSKMNRSRFVRSIFLVNAFDTFEAVRRMK